MKFKKNEQIGILKKLKKINKMGKLKKIKIN